MIDGFYENDGDTWTKENVKVRENKVIMMNTCKGLIVVYETHK